MRTRGGGVCTSRRESPGQTSPARAWTRTPRLQDWGRVNVRGSRSPVCALVKVHEQANAPPWGAQRSHPSLSFPGGPSVCPGDRDLPARGQGCSRELTAGRGRASLCPGGNGGGPGTPRRQTVALLPLSSPSFRASWEMLASEVSRPSYGV